MSKIYGSVLSLESNITWINAFPKKYGISKTLSTSAIVFGTPNKILLTLYYNLDHMYIV